MKRTTLILENAVMDAIKKQSLAAGVDMSELVNEFLRQGLIQKRTKPKQQPSLPVFNMGKPHFNLADRDALERAMES
ncbi:MAG: hypothetical protein EBT75_08685 [Proteobacteria bacterium]|nr:hypothetical protein [Pseudomonadota bacterium]NBS50037.1 hypothetical protein [Verrucomicrobiota bacterium]NBS78366.1 hypothetical protein [bacterium]